MSVHVSTPADNSPEPLPLVISEQQIELFKFYLNQIIHDGMQYNNELYRLAKEFTIDARLAAYQFGCELIRQGIPVIIGVSSDRYAIWTNLRHSSAAN